MTPRPRKDPQGWSEPATTAVADVPENVAEVAPPQSLDLEHFRLGPTGLVVKGQPTFEEWESIGNMLRLFEQGVQFLIGDWVNFGEGAFGEAAAQVLDATQWTESTIRNYSWVAAKVPPANRVVVPGIHFSHHQVIAELSVPDQRIWLDRAVQGEWSVKQLKDAVRQTKVTSGLLTVKVIGEVVLENEADGEKWLGEMLALGRPNAKVVTS